MASDVSKYFDETYNNESNLIESLYAFHPSYFHDLSADEFSTLQTYYMFAVSDVDMPEDVFAYRAELLRHEPSVEVQARDIYKRIIARAGVVE